MTNKKLTIDDFGEMIDDLLTNSRYSLIIDSPEGTENVTMTDTIGLGPVVHFYILLQALETTFKGFKDIIAEDMNERFIDAMLALVKRDILAEGTNDSTGKGDKHEEQ